MNHGPVRVYWSLGAAATALGTGLYNAIKERNSAADRKNAIVARTALGIALTSAGQPLITALGNVSAAKDAEDQRAAVRVLMHSVVATAQSECGRQSGKKCDTRAAFYKFVGPDLALAEFRGRMGDPPRNKFTAGKDEHDDEAIRVARSRRAVVVDDLENDPPPHFIDNKGRSYKSFIAVPVRAGDKSFGLLIADSILPYTLLEVDKGYLILLAGILAAGIAQLEATEEREAGSVLAMSVGDSGVPKPRTDMAMEEGKGVTDTGREL